MGFAALSKHLRPKILNRDANISRPCARMVGVRWFFASAMARALCFLWGLWVVDPHVKKFRAHLFVGPIILTPEVWGAPPEKTKAQPARESRAVRRI